MRFCARFFFLAFLFIFPFGASLFPSITHAESSAYRSLIVTTTGSGTLAMAPGETKNVTLTFQNLGTSSWVNDGAGYISLYTYEPKYRVSAFDPGTWLSPKQVTRLQEVSVAPGGVGTISFSLRAPATPGIYRETFALAAEDRAWIAGGMVTFTISVAEPVLVSHTVSLDPSSDLASSSLDVPDVVLEGKIVAQTATKITAKAKKPVPFMLAVQNIGTTSWKDVALVFASPKKFATDGTEVSFADASWQGQTLATLAALAPGETATLQFSLRTPDISGVHELHFSLRADGEDVSGGEVFLPLTVTGGSRTLDTARSEENVDLLEEPTLRVGVLLVDEETDWEVVIGSLESAVTVRDTNDAVLARLAPGAFMRAAYEDGVYVYGDDNASSSLPLRFVPDEKNAVLTISNFDRRVTRGTSYANNTFRNILELRYNEKKDRTWLINEIPIEYYLRGLAETSNSSPMEFQKALLTAARTYAYYHLLYSSKHAAEGFTVDAYRDQVYWGYDQEARNPLITQAVEDTRGTVVKYHDAVAITSYFSRSDGMTRAWSDVWGGNIPYAQAVAVPCDVGKTLWGHGVGMSASGAICMANDGVGWKDILSYFYTGITIDQVWK